MPDRIRHAIMRWLPWYDVAAVKAREARTNEAVRAAQRTLATLAEYRAAEERRT